MDLTQIREAAATVATLQRTIGHWMAGKTILWVDDHPTNNELVSSVFETAGAVVVVARSTEQGMAHLHDASRPVDLVISDMGRGDDPIAGLRLLRAMHEQGMRIPRVVYSDSRQAREKAREIRDLGAVGPAVGPNNLARAVSRALGPEASPTS